MITSANIGYEKPHREIFQLALDIAGDPAAAWMVGDNVIADVMGAEAAGIKRILVGGRDERAKRNCQDLGSVIDRVASEDGRPA